MNVTDFRSQYSIGVTAVFEDVVKAVTAKSGFGDIGLQKIDRNFLEPRDQFSLFSTVFRSDQKVVIFRLPIDDVYIAISEEFIRPGYSWIKLTMTTLTEFIPYVDEDESKRQMERILNRIRDEAKIDKWNFIRDPYVDPL